MLQMATCRVGLGLAQCLTFREFNMNSDWRRVIIPVIKLSTFLRLKVSGETFRLEVFCLIFSRCSWETIFVPIFVIFFSMFCRENAFFRLSTCRETTNHTCLPDWLNTCLNSSVWLTTCLWFLPFSDLTVSVSRLLISPCSPDHEATPPHPPALPPAQHPRQTKGQ